MFIFAPQKQIIKEKLIDVKSNSRNDFMNRALSVNSKANAGAKSVWMTCSNHSVTFNFTNLMFTDQNEGRE